MKPKAVFTQHPNQESKAGKATYASYTTRNFSDNESLPGRELHRVLERGTRRSSFLSICNLIGRLYRKVSDKITNNQTS
jgi:hypothetical protein